MKLGHFFAVAGVMTTAALLAGCGGSDSSSPASGGGQQTLSAPSGAEASASPSKVETALPGNPAAFKACAPDSIAYPGAAAYAGPAPHPMMVFNGSLQYGIADRSVPSVSSEFQLAACVKRDGVAGKGPSCKTRSGHIRMYMAWYRITIYELRTHRVVASGRVIGEDDTCPRLVVLYGASNEIPSTLSDDQEWALLHPYTDGPPSG